MSFTLNAFITVPDPKHLLAPFEEVCIPVEMVIRKDQFVVCPKARFYKPAKLHIEGVHVVLVEVYNLESEGSHFNYTLKGWRYVTETPINKDMEIDHDRLPKCMRFNF